MVFAITNAQHYREKVEEDLADLMAQIDNSKRAINAVTSTYHLHEWLWRYNLKPMNPPQVNGVVFRNLKDFVEWLELNCPNFNLIQSLANGSKHALPVHSGGRVEGYGEGPWNIGPFSAPYLLIDLGAAAGVGIDRYKMASEVIREGAEFMIKLAKQIGA